MIHGVSIAVIIPCYKASRTIVDVVKSLPEFVDQIIVVDDGCPEQSGKVLLGKVKDSRLKVFTHEKNQGVGGAMVTGYRVALEASDVEILIKMDADGQMDPANIVRLVTPIIDKACDYAKGTRFDSLEDLELMPRSRIFGNAVLSFMSKVSTGYWDINDPTNGFTAIRRATLGRIALNKIRRSYFFESDMLFRLSLIKAVVHDVPMSSIYGSEVSNLKIHSALVEFPRRHFINFGKRIFYNYYLREWNVASLELPMGISLLTFGLAAGTYFWLDASSNGIPATSGQALLAAVPIILGLQLLLAFLTFDVSTIPRRVRE